MTTFDTKRPCIAPDAIAPDGSAVRLLCATARGSMALFTLASGLVAKAVAHRTVEEIWYFLTGRGQMWRRQGAEETIVDVYPGICLTIPLGTHFQFRSFGYEPLSAVGVTMPPWPGEGEAVPLTGPVRPKPPAAGAQADRGRS